MGKDDEGSARRTAQARVVQNDDRVLDAVVEVACAGGWADLTASSVSRAAGLSTRPIHNRFDGRSSMAAAALRNRCAPALLASLAEVLKAAGLLEPDVSGSPPVEGDGQGSPTSPYAKAVFRRSPQADPWERVRDVIRATAAKEQAWPPSATLPNPFGEPESPSPATSRDLAASALSSSVQELLDSLERTSLAAAAAHLEDLRAAGPSSEWLGMALDAFNRPAPAVRATAELLIVSQFDEVLAAAAAEHIASRVTDWCTPSRTGPSPATAARRAYLISLALGLVLAHTRAGAADIDLQGQAEAVFAALRSDLNPAPLPKARAAYLDQDIAFDTGDGALDALLQATLDEISVRGFEGATTSGIARAAGCSDGLIFARYPTKLALFLDASKRQQALSFRNYDDYQTSVRIQHGMGIADALAIREVQLPNVRLQRATYLEQIRLSWHDEELQRTLAAEFDQFVADATAADPGWAPASSPSDLHVSIALGFGIAMLPLLAPEAWSLPYDVATIPVADHPPAP